MNNNSVIYEPDFIILNNELLTSLCVYFDELILITDRNIENELHKIADEKKINYKGKIEYIQNTLLPLSKEGVITLYDSEEILNICPNSLNIDLGDISFQQVDDKVSLNVNSLTDNEITRALINKILRNNCTVKDLLRVLNVYSLSMEYNIPIIKNDIDNSTCNAVNLSNSLAINTLCELALPRIKTTNPEDIVKIRKELRDELIEFRSGILDMTYLLYQAIKGSPKDINDLNQEIDILINTKIKSSVVSLEHKMYSNRKTTLSRV